MLIPFCVDEASAEALVALPESGMGWQHVTAIVGGKRRSLLILGGIFAVDLTPLNLVPAHGFHDAVANTDRVMRALRPEVNLQDRRNLEAINLAGQRIGATSPAVPHPALAHHPASQIVQASAFVKTRVTTEARRFYRFSPYKTDPRIDPSTGHVAAGTYWTTESELSVVPSGFAAVCRYALPTISPPSYRHEVHAPVGTFVSLGTVSSAFGQAGGGIEAYFAAPLVNAAAYVQPTQLVDD